MINWMKPSLAREMGEIQRAMKEVRPFEFTDFVRAFSTTDLTDLDDETWNGLDNTRSSGPIVDMDEVCNILADDGSNQPRRPRLLYEKMRQGIRIEAPLIIAFADRTHLVAGDMRLMICKAVVERPKVCKVQM